MGAYERNTIDERQVTSSVLVDDIDISIDQEQSDLVLRVELANERDTRLRLAAEYDNFRRRVRGVMTRGGRRGQTLCADADVVDRRRPRPRRRPQR